MILTPLRVVLGWSAAEGPSTDAFPHPFLEAAYRAFVGRSASLGPTSVPNWITGADLQPMAFRRFNQFHHEGAQPAQLFNGVLHTLVVAWVGNEQAINDDAFVTWLCQVWDRVDASQGHSQLLVGVPDERLRAQLYGKANAIGANNLSNCQMRTWESLGELACRPATVAISALERAREALCRGLELGRRRLQLFVSHAKLDGYSLAQALTHMVGQIRGLEAFYDARDIDSGSNWEGQLIEEVESSVLVALRTDEYEERNWCVREAASAEAAGVPIIVVEARLELFYYPSKTALDSSPWVRIPDGSLTRIVYCALRENLRVLLLRRSIAALGPKVSRACVVLPRIPTWASVDGAIKQLADKKASPGFVVYPDPKLPPAACEALARFVDGRGQEIKVRNYSELVATEGAVL